MKTEGGKVVPECALSLLAKAVEVFVAANEKPAIANRRRRKTLFADLVACHAYKLRAWFHNIHRAIVVQKINEPTSGDERGMVLAQSFRP